MYIFLLVLGTLLLALIGLWLLGERGRLVLPSTIKIIKEAGLRRIANLSALHGYIYGRWINLYIKTLILRVFPRLGPKGKKWLSDRYHGKVLTHEHARAIITINQTIPLQDLEQIIPYPMARELVITGPPDLAVIECPCRHARAEPCTPTQVCMAIGQPFVDFILEHHPASSRRLSQEEALELLAAENQRGHMHSAWFKDACLDRFYMICNCCSCCCGGIEGMKRYKIPSIAPSGYVAEVDRNLCTVCGTCVEACPFDALSLEETGVVMEWDSCMGCGVCVTVCPSGARSMMRDEGKGLPLDVRLLTKEKMAV